MGHEIVRIDQIDPNTPITIPTADQPISLSVRNVIEWLAPGAPPGEALKFLLTCRAAEVNPFLGEAHLVQMGPKWVCIIDKSGWLRRAETHPGFDGWQAGIILRTITKGGKGPDGKDLPPTYGPLEDHEGAVQPAGYQLVGGWSKVYRKDRKLPIVARVGLAEYKKPAPNWDNMPCTMIRKVALTQALREAGFLTPGTYDQDEVPALEPVEPAISSVEGNGRAIAPPAEVPAAIEAEFEEIPTHQLDPALVDEMAAAVKAAGMTPYQVQTMLGKRGVSSVVELSTHDAREILSKLYQVIDQKRAGEIMLPDPAPGGDEADVETTGLDLRAEPAGAITKANPDATDAADGFEIPAGARRA
jgi:phage recombination protein Bet